MGAFFRSVRMGVACLLLLIFAAVQYPTFVLAEDWRFPFVIFLPAGIVGAVMLRGVRRERKRLARQDADSREVAVLRMAVREGGTLTATQVVTRMSWPMEMALETLRAVEDGGRVTSRVTAEGVLVFEFREAMYDAARAAASLAPAEPATADPVAAEPAAAEPAAASAAAPRETRAR